MYKSEVVLQELVVDYFLYKVNFFCKDVEKIEVGEALEGKKNIAVYFKDENDFKKNKKVISHIFEEVSKQPAFKSHTIYKNEFQPVCTEDIFNEVVKEEQVHEFSKGLISYGGLFLKLVDFFDNKFKELAQVFGATVVAYPTLMPESELDKCKYIDSFPQYINFVNHLDEDIDKIHSFTENRDNSNFKEERYVLSPAVCLHCYIEKQDRKIESSIITAKGRCFRYESNNLANPHRLRDFTMREIVFLGDEEFVSKKREESIQHIVKLLDELKLGSHIESASDPFFVGDSQSKLFQMLTKLKYEIRMNIPFNSKTIAVGSFNIHGNHFGKAYNIKMNNEKYIYTGCTAFGLERWAYAFLSQYGLAVEKWPEEVANYIR